MKEQRDLSFWKLWNLSFGFFGVQIAYALQSSQVSRIFSTIGADPHQLSYFWVLPPLMGLIVQPIVGYMSDRTWNQFGRRLPYLLVGAIVATLVMCFLPNSGSLGLGISAAIVFGLIMLMLLDTSINLAMQPFKMLVGDMVNERQKGKAYSIQSFLCNAGSLVGYIAPFVLAMFLANTAPAGEVPPSVTWAFYLGAFILMLCVGYTFWKVKEMPPHEYNAFHGITEDASGKTKGENIFVLLGKAPKVFWTVGLVQFFCWAAFLFMWTYSTDALASQAFNAPVVQNVKSVEIDGNDVTESYLFKGNTPLLENGVLAYGALEIDGVTYTPQTATVDGVTVIENGAIASQDDNTALSFATEIPAGSQVALDTIMVNVQSSAHAVPALQLLQQGDVVTRAHIAVANADGTYSFEEATNLNPVQDPASVTIKYDTVLNPASPEYQDAGNWNGNLLAIQSIAAVLWAIALGYARRRKPAYCLSLILGAVGFISVFFFHTLPMLAISYALMGCAWAAMLAMPFTILTNALSGGNIGAYLGLFNCTITIPQIVAALLGGKILGMFGRAANGAAPTVMMLVVSGVLLLLGAASVWIIKETSGNKNKVDVLEATEATETQELADL